MEGDPIVKPRAPITVKDNGDGTFTIIDGLATTSAAKILGWKFLPMLGHVNLDQVTRYAHPSETRKNDAMKQMQKRAAKAA